MIERRSATTEDYAGGDDEHEQVVGYKERCSGVKVE